MSLFKTSGIRPQFSRMLLYNHSNKSPVAIVYHSPEAPLSQRVRSLDMLYNQINSKHSLPERGTTSKVSLK